MKISLILILLIHINNLFSANNYSIDTYINLESFILNRSSNQQLDRILYTPREELLLHRLFTIERHILITSRLFNHEESIHFELLVSLHRQLTEQRNSNDRIRTIVAINRQHQRYFLFIQHILERNSAYRNLQQQLRNIRRSRREINESGRRRQRDDSTETDSASSSQNSTIALSQSSSPLTSISLNDLFSLSTTSSRASSSSNQTIPYDDRDEN